MIPGNQTWRIEFARTAARRRAETEHFQRQHEERKERARESDKAEDGVTELAAATIIATDSQIADFNATLDKYDAAVVEALDDNRRELEQVRAELDSMLAQAYVLDDGRRVFEMDDGVTVIDEHGDIVSPDIITADEIPDHHPSGNRYLAEREYEAALEEQRTDLLEYQGDLDAARNAGAQDGVTAQQLDEILDDIKLGAPIEVQRHMPGYVEPEHADARSEFSQAAAEPLADIRPDPALQPSGM